MLACVALAPPSLRLVIITFDSMPTLRPLTLEDIPAGLSLCRASGWNQLAEDWRMFLESPRGGGFAATNNGAVMGTVTFIRYDTVSWIAMMLVAQEHRGSGIGSQLLQQALSSLQEEPCVGLDATPAGEPLYRRHGFVAGSGLVRLKAAVEGRRFQAEADRVRPMTAADLPHVFARDRNDFGADRSILLSSFYERAPQSAWITTEGGELLGYCFGRPGHLYHQLGPIVAERDEIARGLVRRCLQDQGGKFFVIDAPRESPEWLSWLQSAGFVEERPLLRMYRGAPGTHPPSHHFAIAGPEFS